MLATPTALRAAGTVDLDTFDLPPGASVTITFDVDVDNPLDVCASSVSNQGTVMVPGFPDVLTDVDGMGPANPTVTPLDAVDLAITKTDLAATAVPGTPISYTIVVSNTGPSAATNATVTDNFPVTLTGISWTCAGSGGGASCTAAGAGNISDSVNVPVGQMVTYMVNATIAPDAPSPLVNTATVTAVGQIECNLANNSATDTNTLTPQVDLEITKDDFLTEINAGAPTTYTITVTNTGPSDAVNATVADTFPAALLSPTWTCGATPSSSCTAAGAGNINDSVTVRAGGMLTYMVNATVSGTFSGNLANTATVAAAGGTTDTNPGNNSATDNTDVLPIADLMITKNDGVTTAVPGLTVTYTIIASNPDGPATATDATVTDTFPSECASVSWTCVGALGGTCTAGPVAGNIADATVDLPPGGTATYTAICTLADDATGMLENTATISGGGVSDPTPGNNSATDTDTILALDFGDAPDGSLTAPSGYPTLLADDGARHGITALKMGPEIDDETDGQPTVNADGDDQVDAPDLDDEDGVTLPAQLVTCETANVTVNASAIARLDAWVDFDADGSFEVGEKVFNNVALVAGNNNLSFPVPCTATPVAKSFARFRISTAGGLQPDDVAADGEVEDYTVVIRGLDFGDAPDPAYPTLFASNGARHVVAAGVGPILGASIDTEVDGQPNAAATGDDAAGIDDEDGVSFASPLIPGQSANVTVTASAPGTLNAWIDFNADGSFATLNDQIFTNQALVAGANNLVFNVPATASSNTPTVARFRIATAGGLSFTGLAADGEVEDHAVATAAVADLSITKDDGGATEAVPGTMVTYEITVSNLTGPDPIDNATVTDTFAGILSGITWTCAGTGTCNPAGAGNINQLVDLPVGASVTFMATGTIDPTATGTLVNTATVTLPGAAFDPNLSNNSATDTDTLTPQVDLVVEKTESGDPVTAGAGILTYVVMVTNAGPSTATSVTLSEILTLPAGVTVNSVTPSQGSFTAPTWTVGTLAPSASATLTVMLTAAASTAAGTDVICDTAAVTGADQTLINIGNDTATLCSSVIRQVDLEVSKDDDPDDLVIAGSGIDNLTHTVTVMNDGPSDASGITLSEVLTLPAGVTVSSVTPSQGSFVSPNWTVGNLAPDASATLTVILTVSASTVAGTDVICDTATVTGAAETLVNTGNDSDTECTSVSRQVEIVVTKTESIETVIAGSGPNNLTHTVTVMNDGPSDASGITLSEVITVPAGVTIDSVTPSQGSFLTPNWTVGNLASGASATLTVVLTASAMAAEGTDVICDTATLTNVNEPQASTSNDTATECTSITFSADLEIMKVDDVDPPPAGSNLTYTITVMNHGPSNATGVVVTDMLPAAVTYVSDTCGGSNVPPWTWNIGDLADEAMATCEIEVSINPTPPASISNTATVMATTNDAVPGNNSDMEDTTLDAVPPTITNVDSIPGSDDGELDDCDTVLAAVRTLRVRFSELMATSGGGSVTDISNWRVVQPGAGLPFATTDCAGGTGTDQIVDLDSVSWNAGTFEATLSFSSTPLDDGQYRLVLCETTTDPAGNAIVGDGVTGGTPLLRTFRVDRFNLLADAHFDTVDGCNLDAWISTTPMNVTIDSPDAGGAATSGSASNTFTSVGFDIAQCVPVRGGRIHRLEAAIRATVASGSISFDRSCGLFSAPACGGTLLAEPVFTNGFLASTGATFLELGDNAMVPAMAMSALCSFIVRLSSGGAADVWVDDIFFGDRTGIFADGFESGDTSAWSITQPPPFAPIASESAGATPNP